MDIKELVKSSLSEGKAAAEELSRLKGFNVKSLRGLISCVKWGVKRAEEVGLAHGLAGADKKEFAMELIRQVAPLPWYLEMVRDAVLPHLIDAIVDALKDKFGK